VVQTSDDVFRSLFSLRICERASIESETGKLWVLIGDKKREIPIEHIDEMESRGWVLMAFDARGIHRKTWHFDTRLEATVARRRLLKSEGGLA
jgi:hypothetical protein